MDRGFPSQAVTVAANQTWHSTGITVDGDLGVTIAYQTGMWQVDDDGVDYDANGNPMYDASSSGAPLPGCAVGGLIGRIGTGHPFWVGDGPTVVPKGESGPLELVINDDLTYTSNPNQALVDALAIQAPSDFITLAVSSSNGNGAVSNIGFEQKNSNVTAYDFTCWLESFDGGTSFPQLQYTQTITMLLTVRGGRVSFPHVTVNTLTKKSS